MLGEVFERIVIHTHFDSKYNNPQKEKETYRQTKLIFVPEHIQRGRNVVVLKLAEDINYKVTAEITSATPDSLRFNHSEVH